MLVRVCRRGGLLRRPLISPSSVETDSSPARTTRTARRWCGADARDKRRSLRHQGKFVPRVDLGFVLADKNEMGAAIGVNSEPRPASSVVMMPYISPAMVGRDTVIRR